MTFAVGETVVYPNHGTAVIEDIEARTIKGEERLYLVLRIVGQTDLVVRVPACNLDLVGVRDVVDADGSVDDVARRQQARQLLAEGRLRVTSPNGVASNRLYDGQDLVAEYNSASALTVRYVHGPGVDEPLVVYEGATTTAKSWLYKDHLGSIVGAADGAGTSTAVYSYGPYGEPNSATGQRFRYTGQQLIGEPR